MDPTINEYKLFFICPDKTDTRNIASILNIKSNQKELSCKLLVKVLTYSPGLVRKLCKPVK